MTEIYRINRNLVQSENELVQETPRFVAEALDILEKFGAPEVKDEESLINSLFDSNIRPENDMDRDGWLRLLGTSILGHAVQTYSDIYEKNEIRFIKNRLDADYKHWRNTWKERPVEGQLERTYGRFKDYSDKHEKSGEKFPWLKVAGNVIICLVRLDNPNYQK